MLAVSVFILFLFPRMIKFKNITTLNLILLALIDLVFKPKRKVCFSSIRSGLHNGRHAINGFNSSIKLNQTRYGCNSKRARRQSTLSPQSRKRFSHSKVNMSCTLTKPVCRRFPFVNFLLRFTKFWNKNSKKIWSNFVCKYQSKIQVLSANFQTFRSNDNLEKLIFLFSLISAI